LPTVNEAERIQQYRPICFLNVSFKIFTKTATIRPNTVAGHARKKHPSWGNNPARECPGTTSKKIGSYLR
jgi:hypothetical protein